MIPLLTRWQDRFEEIFSILCYRYHHQWNVAQWCDLREYPPKRSSLDHLTWECACYIQWGFSVAQYINMCPCAIYPQSIIFSKHVRCNFFFYLRMFLTSLVIRRVRTCSASGRLLHHPIFWRGLSLCIVF